MNKTFWKYLQTTGKSHITKNGEIGTSHGQTVTSSAFLEESGPQCGLNDSRKVFDATLSMSLPGNEFGIKNLILS